VVLSVAGELKWFFLSNNCKLNLNNEKMYFYNFGGQLLGILLRGL